MGQRSLPGEGRHPLKKVVYFRALPELAKPPPPTPQFGQLGPFFPDVKTTFCAYDRKTVPMMIMMIAMIIMIVMMVILMIMMTKMTKTHTNIKTLLAKNTNHRNFYLVKRGQQILANSDMPESNFFFADVFPFFFYIV